MRGNESILRLRLNYACCVLALCVFSPLTLPLFPWPPRFLRHLVLTPASDSSQSVLVAGLILNPSVVYMHDLDWSSPFIFAHLLCSGFDSSQWKPNFSPSSWGFCDLLTHSQRLIAGWFTGQESIPLPSSRLSEPAALLNHNGPNPSGRAVSLISSRRSKEPKKELAGVGVKAVCPWCLPSPTARFLKLNAEDY